MKNSIYSKMFGWLFIGLLITFAAGYSLSLNELLLMQILSVGIFPIIIIEIVVALLMGFRIQKMKPLTAKICYILYSIITGVTFSTIFITFEMSSIIMIFLITAISFGLLAAYGYFTKRDVTKIGNMLFVALLAIIIISIINIFLRSSSIEIGISIISILIFMGYIIYDMNNIKYLLDSIGDDKAAVYGAFQLYLDFINIFIRLLQFFGKRND